eukprot:1034583-Pyramimonas_sp.AAC.1
MRGRRRRGRGKRRAKHCPPHDGSGSPRCWPWSAARAARTSSWTPRELALRRCPETGGCAASP